MLLGTAEHSQRLHHGDLDDAGFASREHAGTAGIDSLNEVIRKQVHDDKAGGAGRTFTARGLRGWKIWHRDQVNALLTANGESAKRSRRFSPARRRRPLTVNPISRACGIGFPPSIASISPQT